MTLKSISTINSDSRNSSIDIFRGFAIITVMLFHFNSLLLYGNLGVDLFFVISGFLVSGLLLKDFTSQKQINFLSFVLQRGFKIWPSYYTFLLLGNLVVYIFCSSYAPNEVIPFYDYKRYLFFYQNYTGLPQSNVFYGVWSLCVEEHFYILLPILLILLQKINGKQKLLFSSVFAVIVLGVIFKLLVLYLTRSKDTYAATHNRIDALAWGVLLNLIITYSPKIIRKFNKNFFLVFLGVVVLGTAIVIANNTSSEIYHKVVFHSLVPFSFFLMIGGLYHIKITRLKAIRFIAYYSYNLYLWHPIILLIVKHYIGFNLLGFMAFVLLTFLTAILCTILVEEPFLKMRKGVLTYLFRSKSKVEEIAGMDLITARELQVGSIMIENRGKNSEYL